LRSQINFIGIRSSVKPLLEQLEHNYI